LSIAALAIAAVGGFAASALWQGSKSAPERSSAVATSSTSGSGAGKAQTFWVAAAPGRVEPRSGEVRVGAGAPGRVVEVLVSVGAKVEEGELLVRLEDDEIRARLAAAEAEALARKSERDKGPVTAGRENVTRAEDAVYTAERSVTGARFELDYALKARRDGTGSERAVSDARRRLTDAKERLTREQQNLATAQTRSGIPAPSRMDSAVTAARADVSVAEAMLEKTRIRAPIGGSVLQLLTKTGEFVGPSAEFPLVFVGDTSGMRVKAEVDEPDVGKIKVGQRAFVRSAAFPGQEFAGRVTRLAPTLAMPRINQRGPRRPTDLEVMEVTIDLEGNAPLITGMRAEAFFRRD
jgi:HlyD family secretion protein